MGLIKPEINSLLRSAGITRNGIHKVDELNEQASISEKLDAAGLSVVDLFLDLKGIINAGDSDTVKLNAIKTALEAHKVMKGDAPQGTVVNINIIDNSDNSTTSINPMLLPRQLSAASAVIDI